MKRHDDNHLTFRTIIEDITPGGSELSDEQLRLVAGGKPKNTYRRGMTSCTNRKDGSRSVRPDNSPDA
jgi:hypothetical protein